MDLNEIREIIEIDGGKFIIIENGRPVMVVTSFENYKSSLKMKNYKVSPNEQAETIKHKKETLKETPRELENEELKIENLPF